MEQGAFYGHSSTLESFVHFHRQPYHCKEIVWALVPALWNVNDSLTAVELMSKYLENVQRLLELQA